MICRSIYILREYMQYPFYLDKRQILKKIPSDKLNGTKKPSFFLHQLQLITVLLLTRDSFTSWSTGFVSLRVPAGFSFFDYVSSLLKVIFLFNKMHGLFDFENFIITFKIKITEKPPTVLHPDLWFLSWNKKSQYWMTSAWVGTPQKRIWWQFF